MPIAPVLQRFVDDELARAPALAERTLAGTLMLLRDAKDRALTPLERGHHFEVVEALQTHGEAYRWRFVEKLTESVVTALHEADLEAISAEPKTVGGPGLELMDESSVEVDIEISRALQTIDTTAEWELRELQTFTSTLIGLTHVTAESNPLRPVFYAGALWEAACIVSPQPAHRAMLLRLSASVAAGLLKKAWAAACTRLESQGVEPSIYRTVLLPAGSPGGRGPAPPDTARSGAMAELLARMPGAADAKVGVGHAAGPVGAPPVHGSLSASTPEALARAITQLEEALRRLNLPASTSGGRELPALIAQQLGPQRAALMASAGAPAERQVIELVGRVFDSMVSDPQLAGAFAPVITRLQASALRVALRDPALLDSVQHPLWQLLDRIGEIATAHGQPGDPRGAAALAECQRLAEQVSASLSPDAALYRDALSSLDAFLTARRQAALVAAQAAVDALAFAEQRLLLERRMAERLIEQIATVRTTPTVRRFMTGAWARVLAQAMLVDGEQAETTRGHIKLVDELLWSVQLPDHPQSRQRLIALLPGMLSRLRAGMASIDLPAAEQDALLAELMTIHTEALRPGARVDADTLTPQQIVQRMRDEVLPVATGHGGFSDSVIDLGSMQTVPAELMADAPATPVDAAAARVDALQAGERMRLFLHGRWDRVQLLWRSEHGLFLLFAAEAPGRTHSVTRRALERLVAAGLMQPLIARPLVQRALDAVTREVAKLS